MVSPSIASENLTPADAGRAADTKVQAAADPFRFDGTHPVMVLYSIKAGSASGFEESFSKMMRSLAASTNANAHVIARSVQLLKVNVPATEQVPGQGPVILYLAYVDEPVPGTSYDPRKLCYYSGFLLPLTESGEPGGTVEQRRKVDDIYNALLAPVAKVTIWKLEKK
jgi:hypothetical protein